MAVKFTKTDDLDKMFEEFAKLPDLTQVTFPDDKNKKEKVEKKKQMTIFQSLPPSILQAGAIFLSIMIEALPFVLIGSIISGWIEVYITPDKVTEFLPRNRWGLDARSSRPAWPKWQNPISTKNTNKGVCGRTCAFFIYL